VTLKPGYLEITHQHKKVLLEIEKIGFNLYHISWFSDHVFNFDIYELSNILNIHASISLYSTWNKGNADSTREKDTQ